MNAPVRTFVAKPAARSEEPLSIGMVGPPGGGKTLSSLKVARGIQSVRGGDIVLIDTEGGRSKKYADQIAFQHVPFDPPCRSEDFLAAIKQQLASKPAAIIVDSMSDEHEGEGGYLEWHDQQVPTMGGNEWAAWAKPKASRKRLITGLLHIKVPLIFTFRAREKTKQNTDPNAKRHEKIVNIGWQPVAPLEIVHALDLTCILPPRADGVPVWHSDKIGEDFIIKLPNYLQPYIVEGKPLSEEMGAGFARWAAGHNATAPASSVQAKAAAPNSVSPAKEPQDGAAASFTNEQVLQEAAERGTEILQVAWNALSPTEKKRLKPKLDETYKPAAMQADKAGSEA